MPPFSGNLNWRLYGMQSRAGAVFQPTATSYRSLAPPGDNKKEFFTGCELEFKVQAEARYDDWTAVPVITWVVDVLHARRDINSSPHMGGVIGL